MMSILNRIIRNQLCLGCGMCESLGKEYGYKMQLANNGFYTVKIPQKQNFKFENEIIQVCPAINLTATKTKNVWGSLESAYYAWSNDPLIRRKGASGGLITGIATYLLQEKIVDAVLHVGTQFDSPLYNELKVSKTPDAILSNASSRYAPVMMFNQIRQLFDATNETYCFVGKPCDVVALKKMLCKYPIYKQRVKFFISL